MTLEEGVPNEELAPLRTQNTRPKFSRLSPTAQAKVAYRRRIHGPDMTYYNRRPRYIESPSPTHSSISLTSIDTRPVRHRSRRLDSSPSPPRRITWRSPSPTYAENASGCWIAMSRSPIFGSPAHSGHRVVLVAILRLCFLAHPAHAGLTLHLDRLALCDRQ